MREYEMTIVVRPDLEDEGFAAATEKVAGYIQQAGGEVTKTDIWGRRRLAYPIQKYREGYYVLLQFQLEAGAHTEVDRDMRLNEDVIRYLIVRTDE